MAPQTGGSSAPAPPCRLRLGMTLLGLLMLAGLLLNGCGAGATTAATTASKSRLDGEIARATHPGLGGRLLAPLTRAGAKSHPAHPAAAAARDSGDGTLA